MPGNDYGVAHPDHSTIRDLRKNRHHRSRQTRWSAISSLTQIEIRPEKRSGIFGVGNVGRLRHLQEMSWFALRGAKFVLLTNQLLPTRIPLMSYGQSGRHSQICDLPFLAPLRLYIGGLAVAGPFQQLPAQSPEHQN